MGKSRTDRILAGDSISSVHRVDQTYSSLEDSHPDSNLHTRFLECWNCLGIYLQEAVPQPRCNDSLIPDVFSRFGYLSLLLM